MGVRILQGNKSWDGAVLYCSVSDWAFGPIFEDEDAAQEFLDWLGDTDPRVFSDQELRAKYHTWLEEREAAKAEEEAEG